MRRLVLFVITVAALAACGTGPEHLAVIANHPAALGPGEQRLVIAYRTAEGEDLGDADTPATLEVSREGGDAQVVQTEFVWIDEGNRGLYVANVELDQPGRWSAVLRPDGRRPTLPSPFEVTADPVTPAIGDPAPVVASATIADAGGDLSTITSDTDPDPGLYELSLDEALTNGRATVAVFATPRFCTSATCGPILDRVKAARATLAEHPVNWVHIEIYSLDDLTNLRVVPAVSAWELPSEPWVFVVDAQGVVRHRFEGTVGEAELAAAVVLTE